MNGLLLIIGLVLVFAALGCLAVAVEFFNNRRAWRESERRFFERRGVALHIIRDEELMEERTKETTPFYSLKP